MFACQVEQSMPIICNSSSNALNTSCCSYKECKDKCVDFSSGIAITIAFTTGILLVTTLNLPLSGHPRYGHVPLPGSMKCLLSQQVNKMAMTTVAFTVIFEGKCVY